MSMDRTIENAFFDIFKQGGIASICVEILEVKYKLNKSLLNQIAGNSDWEEFYTKTLPEQIKQKACELNVDFDTLFTEVGKNLSECKTNPTEFPNYCLSLLSPFADFLRKVKPSKHRERERQMKMDNVRLLLDSGIDEDRELANDIQSRVEVMIADWENIEKEFRTISKKHTEIPTEELEKYFEGNYTETIFAELMLMLKGYAIGLDWIFAQIGIDLLKLQNDGGIYLIESRNIYDYIQFAGTKEIAQKVFNALPDNANEQSILNSEVFGEILQRAIEAGYIEKGLDNYKWKSTKILCAYFSYSVSNKLELGSKVYGKHGEVATNWKPFESFFGLKNLGGSKATWIKENSNQSFYPNGADKIDDIVSP